MDCCKTKGKTWVGRGFRVAVLGEWEVVAMLPDGSCDDEGIVNEPVTWPYYGRRRI